MVPWAARQAGGWYDWRNLDPGTYEAAEERIMSEIDVDDLESRDDLEMALQFIVHPNTVDFWYERLAGKYGDMLDEKQALTGAEAAVDEELAKEGERVISDVETKHDEYVSRTGREPSEYYLETAERLSAKLGHAPTDAEMEEQRRMQELHDSSRMRTGEQAGIIRRAGGEVVSFVKDRLIPWIKRRVMGNEEESQEVPAEEAPSEE